MAFVLEDFDVRLIKGFEFILDAAIDKFLHEWKQDMKPICDNVPVGFAPMETRKSEYPNASMTDSTESVEPIIEMESSVDPEVGSGEGQMFEKMLYHSDEAQEDEVLVKGLDEVMMKSDENFDKGFTESTTGVKDQSSGSFITLKDEVLVKDFDAPSRDPVSPLMVSTQYDMCSLNPSEVIFDGYLNRRVTNGDRNMDILELHVFPCDDGNMSELVEIDDPYGFRLLLMAKGNGVREVFYGMSLCTKAVLTEIMVDLFLYWDDHKLQAINTLPDQPTSVYGVRKLVRNCWWLGLVDVDVDADGSPVTVSWSGDSRRNIIVGMDYRAVKQAEKINSRNSPVLQCCGGSVSSEMQSPKLLWVKENLREFSSMAFRWMDLRDWLSYGATGDDTWSLGTTVCKGKYFGHAHMHLRNGEDSPTPPNRLKMKESYEVNSRGLEIFSKSWLPETTHPKAMVFFCHGYGDTCTFFAEGIARKLASHGYGVFAMDYPGFGLSEGLHCYIHSFDRLVDDVIEQYTKIKEDPNFRTLPCFLFGQSMGGAVALKMHLKQPNAWSGACLVAPMCKLTTWFHPGY